MIDVKLLLSDFDAVAARLALKNVNAEVLESLAAAAQNFKKIKINLEEKQAFQNASSKEIGALMKAGDSTAVERLKTGLNENKKAMVDLESELKSAESALDSLLFSLPNMPDNKTPEGRDERDNVELSRVGEIPTFSFSPKEHWELAAQNGWIDFEAGVKLAKSRFAVLRGMGARLNRALINFMLDYNERAGFEAVVTPAIVNDRMLFGTGQLPKFAQDMFKIDGGGLDDEAADSTLESTAESNIKNAPDSNTKTATESASTRDLYLISTSEITLTNLYHDSIVKESELPILLTAQTPCFRKEAGSAGRDTRGIIRQHQFDKVELVALTTPAQSEQIHTKMVETASGILSALGLPHRLVQLCGGDLGFSAANTIDIEVWLPGQGCYREISSVSNCRDFQARRAKIRYKDEKNKNHLVHTLNGSALAVGRTLVAIMENYQQSDGSIKIPEVLEKYL